MSALRLTGRLSLLWLAGSALGVLAPVWLFLLALYLLWRRRSAQFFVRSLLSLLTVPTRKGDPHV